MQLVRGKNHTPIVSYIFSPNFQQL